MKGPGLDASSESQPMTGVGALTRTHEAKTARNPKEPACNCTAAGTIDVSDHDGGSDGWLW